VHSYSQIILTILNTVLWTFLHFLGFELRSVSTGVNHCLEHENSLTFSTLNVLGNKYVRGVLSPTP
jgi:hypothetical protein